MARWTLLLSCLIACLGVASPTRLAAAPAAPAAVEQCDGCHTAEAEAWLRSPHGVAATGASGLPSATCEECHGAYVRGHPDDDRMRLPADSAMCESCHTPTFGQWQDSVHAQAGVQCIGCHLSHSQALRLDEQTLCLSCHRDSLDDGFHISHQVAAVPCVDCHLAPSTAPLVTTSAGGATQITIPAPNHDFVTVAAGSCIECHSEDVRSAAASALGGQMTPVELLEVANRVPALTSDLAAAHETNRSLVGVTIASLGLGLGAGGMMGIVLVLAVGYVMQRRPKP
jgi:predicted CXXCH cytochrome family protein